MTCYDIFALVGGDEAPLQRVGSLDAYGFAHALEIALANNMVKGPGLVVVKTRKDDALKVYKVGARGGFTRP